MSNELRNRIYKNVLEILPSVCVCYLEEIVDAALAATSAPSEPMKCGHPLWLALRSVESDTVLCELCEMRQQRDDAVLMEQELREQVLHAGLSLTLGQVDEMIRAAGLVVSPSTNALVSSVLAARLATSAPQSAPAVRLTEFECAARNVQHALSHDGPGDVVIALREQLLPVLAGMIEECGYLPELKRAPAVPVADEPEPEEIDWFMAPLHPCPRCGNHDVHRHHWMRSDSSFMARIDCDKCGLEGAEDFECSMESIVTDWNKLQRSAPSAAPGVRICPASGASARRSS